MLRINTKYYRITEDLKLEELEYVGKDGNKFVFHDQYLAEVKMFEYATELLNPSRIMALNELEEKLRFRIDYVHDQLKRHKVKFNPVNGIEIAVVNVHREISVVPVHKYHKNGQYIESYPSGLSAYRIMTGRDDQPSGSIFEVCKGKRRTAYGYRWSYVKFSKLPKLPKVTRTPKSKVV